MFPLGTSQNPTSGLDSLILQQKKEEMLKLSSMKADANTSLAPQSLQQLQNLQTPLNSSSLLQLQGLQNMPVDNRSNAAALTGSSSLQQLQALQGLAMDRPAGNTELLAALLERERIRQEAQRLTAAPSHLSLLQDAMASEIDPGLLMNRMALQNTLAAQPFQQNNTETMPNMIRSNGLDNSLLAKMANGSVSSAFHRPEAFTGTNSIASDLRVEPSYFDASTLDDPDPITLANRRKRGGVSVPFPEKLHELITDAEANGNSDIISFFPHGRAFAVHNVERFKNEIMPKYFKQSRFSSFQRQLNLYGFSRITQGRDSGGYYHEYFLQGRPALAIHMKRVGFPKGPFARGSSALKAATVATPDFYSWVPIKKSSHDIDKDAGGEK